MLTIKFDRKIKHKIRNKHLMLWEIRRIKIILLIYIEIQFAKAVRCNSRQNGLILPERKMDETKSESNS